MFYVVNPFSPISKVLGINLKAKKCVFKDSLCCLQQVVFKHMLSTTGMCLKTHFFDWIMCVKFYNSYQEAFSLT